jgi:hypothetical protein
VPLNNRTDRFPALAAALASAVTEQPGYIAVVVNFSWITHD